MTFYNSFNDNHQKIIDLTKANTSITAEVAKKNIIDYSFDFLGQNRFPAIAINIPEYFPGESQGMGVLTYELHYRIFVASDLLGPSKSRKQLMTIASAVMEMLESVSNTDLDDTCTYSNVLRFNPNAGIGGSEKAMQRIGEIRFMTAHGISRPI
jgi:hypothetical protein